MPRLTSIPARAFFPDIPATKPANALVQRPVVARRRDRHTPPFVPPEAAELAWTVKATLQIYCRPGDRLLLAISGGPDSVALGHAMRSLPYDTRWMHVDHGLRAGAAGDARFVRSLAKKWAVPLKIAKVVVRRYAVRKGLGIEEAGRALRYAALGVWAKRLRCRAIITAHHADDQAETVLLHLLRGAGPAGLAGIPVQRPSNGSGSIDLIRPLLGVPRTAIRAYLKDHRIRFRVDPTNRNQNYARNRLRHHTLPQLTQQHPGLAGRLQQLADILRLEEDFWDNQVGRGYARAVRRRGRTRTVDLNRLLGYHKALARRILRRLLPGFSFQDIERVYSLAQSSHGTGQLQLAGRLMVTRHADKLVIVY